MMTIAKLYYDDGTSAGVAQSSLHSDEAVTIARRKAAERNAPISVRDEGDARSPYTVRPDGTIVECDWLDDAED